MANTTVTFTVPDAKAQLFLDAFCSERGYDAAVDGTKVAFFKAELQEIVRLIISDYFRKQRNTEAQSNLKTDLDSMPITTS